MIFPVILAASNNTRAEYTVENYASIPWRPVEISFDSSGTLYVGWDVNGDALAPGRIWRVEPGGSNYNSYGDTDLWDPDSVVVVPSGGFAGYPEGTVLVGGTSETFDNAYLAAILPNQSTEFIWNPGTVTFASGPSMMEFDSNNRLLLVNSDASIIFVSADGETPAALTSVPGGAGTIAIDQTNRIFVRERSQGDILIYSSDGTLIESNFVTALGADEAEYDCLAFGPGTPLWGNDLYTISHGDLVRIDSAGNVLPLIEDIFTNPVNLAFGPDGALYACSGINGGTREILRIIPEPITLSLLVLGSTLLIRKRRA